MRGETSRKCWHMINPVLCVYGGWAAPLWPYKRIHTVSDTPPFSLCWWCFFIFSTDRVSSPPIQQPEVLSNTTPCILEQFHARSAAYVTQTLVIKWSRWSVDCRSRSQGVRGRRMPGKPIENLKLQSHCDALPSVWRDTEGTAGWKSKLTGR